jgi:PAS domain-containing protein
MRRPRSSSALYHGRRSLIEVTPKALRGQSGGTRRPLDDNLAKSQARLINIVDSVTDAIFGTHTDGCILLFNAAAERIFRCPAADAIGEPIGRFLPAGIPSASPDRRFHVIQALRAAHIALAEAARELPAPSADRLGARPRNPTLHPRTGAIACRCA